MYPVIIRIQGKGDFSHVPIGQLLLESIASIFDPLARGLDVVDADANMSKTLSGIGIAIGNFEAVISFRPVPMAKLEHALAIRPVSTWRGTFGGIVGQEIEVKFLLRI